MGSLALWKESFPLTSAMLDIVEVMSPNLVLEAQNLKLY